MDSLIGQRLREFPGGLAAMTALCGVVVAINLLCCAESHLAWHTQEEMLCTFYARHNAYKTRHGRYLDALAAHENHSAALRRYFETTEDVWRCEVALAVLLLAFFPVLANGRLSSIGISFTPSGGWRYWCLASLGLVLAVTILAVPAAGLWWLLGGRAADLAITDWSSGESLMSQFLRAPFAEEVIYRMGICSVAAAWLGPRWAIAVSGSLFALAHLVFGGANPVNLAAGFLLAWAFLKSNSIIVPMVLHSLGNLLGWYVMTHWLIAFCHD